MQNGTFCRFHNHKTRRFVQNYAFYLLYSRHNNSSNLFKYKCPKDDHDCPYSSTVYLGEIWSKVVWIGPFHNPKRFLSFWYKKIQKFVFCRNWIWKSLWWEILRTKMMRYRFRKMVVSPKPSLKFSKKQIIKNNESNCEVSDQVNKLILLKFDVTRSKSFRAMDGKVWAII